jgi:hypothetical protein
MCESHILQFLRGSQLVLTLVSGNEQLSPLGTPHCLPSIPEVREDTGSSRHNRSDKRLNHCKKENSGSFEGLSIQPESSKQSLTRACDAPVSKNSPVRKSKPQSSVNSGDTYPGKYHHIKQIKMDPQTSLHRGASPTLLLSGPRAPLSSRRPALLDSKHQLQTPNSSFPAVSILKSM